MNKMVKKHDLLAKKFLTNITVAKEFIKQYLPETILSRCSLDSLKIEPCSFVDDSLSAYYADKLDMLENSSNDANTQDKIDSNIADDNNITAKGNLIIKMQLQMLNINIMR